MIKEWERSQTMIVQIDCLCHVYISEQLCPPMVQDRFSGNTSRMRDPHLWAFLIVILVIAYLSVAVYFRWINVSFRVEQYLFSHWMSWAGALYLALVTPAAYVLRRRYPRKIRLFRSVHMYGNLLAFALISIHFYQQIGRSPQAFPRLGTGVAQYAMVLTLVFTGFIQRFRLLQNLDGSGSGRSRALAGYLRTLHVSSIIAFYFVIVLHILHGLRIT